MEQLLSELADEFGPGRIFRPYRDVRFSADKSPYKTNCSASVGDGYLALSARELKVASGLYVAEADELQRYRAAVDAEASGAELAKIVGALRAAKYEITAHDLLKTAPKGWSQQHPRIELLRYKGIAMTKTWPIGAWLGNRKAKDRVVRAFQAAAPLNEWLDRHVRSTAA
jgi:uncharacterized protein (TIGR02453 family)